MNAPTAPGAMLDARYRVGSIIARGGMSTVYRGVDTRLDRPVALKIMESRMAADPAYRMRFEREARSAARIDHPAVVDVFDQGDHMGVDGPVVFLVMELVEGGTLRDVLRNRGPLGVPAAIAVLEPVLAGLAEAHHLGLVHRDVKPENVLISDAHEVKVADFGLVTAAAQAGHSHAGVIMGTVAYLSPEQVATGAADARSDVYAAGIMLYEMLTGAPPYTGDSAISVAYQHVNSEVPAPSRIAGDVPPELDELVRRATRRDPAARPADAAALLGELRRVATLLSVPRIPAPAPPPRPVEEQVTVPSRRPVGPSGTRAMARPEPDDQPPPHLRARRRSRRVFALWIAVVLVLCLVIGTVAWWIGAGRWTAMPSLVGVEQAVAERLLAEADLRPRFTVEYAAGVAAGVVAATDPDPQAELLRGSLVTLTVSTGPPVVPPIAAGTPLADAQKAVRDVGLDPVQDDSGGEFSDTVPAGAVLRTSPRAGAPLTPGARVTLVLSKGSRPKLIEVPRLFGRSVTEATSILKGLGLTVREQSRIPFLQGNTVFGTSPEAGAEVAPGTLVTLDTL